MNPRVPPASVGPYRVVRELGRGGMGVVFEVRDPAVADRRLALKLILPGAATDEALARFAREAQLLARVKHPNVVAIHAFARAPEGPYLVTDFVEGEPLERRAEWTPTAAATLVRTLCDAVAALHAQGIVHRDLKPDNLIVRADGSPVLLDFGVARGAGAESLTQSGAVVGTPHYMAPEQAEGKNVVALDARADVYGLGAVLFHLLAGRRPFDERDSAIALMRAVLDLEPRWPSQHDQPQVPRDLEAVCRVAMQKDPARRYATASAMGQDLARWLAGERTLAAAQVRASRRRPAAALIAIAIVAAIAIAALAWAARDPAPASGPTTETKPSVAPSVSSSVVPSGPVASATKRRPAEPLAVRPMPRASWRCALAWHGDTLFFAGDESVARWRRPAEPVNTRFPADWGLSAFAADPTRGGVVVAGSGIINKNRGRFLFLPAEGSPTPPQAAPGDINLCALAVSPRGDVVVMGDHAGLLGFRRIGAPAEEEDDAIQVSGGRTMDLAWSRKGEWVIGAFGSQEPGQGVLRRFRRGPAVWTESVEKVSPWGGFYCVEVVGPDDTVVAGDAGGFVVVLTPGQPERSLVAEDVPSDMKSPRAHRTEVHDLVVSHDGLSVYTIATDQDQPADSEVRVWNLADGAHLGRCSIRGRRERLALSHDDELLAVAGDGQVELWEVDALLSAPGN